MNLQKMWDAMKKLKLHIISKYEGEEFQDTG